MAGAVKFKVVSVPSSKPGQGTDFAAKSVSPFADQLEAARL
jgi:hypothetical protein